MKKIPLVLLFLLVFALVLTSCSDPEPIPAELPEGSITTKNVQVSGWNNMIAGDKYVFSTNGLGIHGTGKINLLTGRITNVCIQPGCLHMPPADIDADPNACRIPSTAELLFAVGEELFYRYHAYVVDYDKVEKDEPDNTETVYIFASYNTATGEYREILRIQSTEFEQMYRFIQSGGYIYYNRQTAKTDRPQKKEDYRLCCCRMKIGEYKEEILFAFEDVCELPDGVLPDPIAADRGRIWFACHADGRLLEVDPESKKSRFFLGGDDGLFGVFDSPGVFYTDGFTYFTARIPALAEPPAVNAILNLYRVNCASGETEKLTEDYIRWFFVSDGHIFYAMAHNYQPAEEQFAEVGTDFSVHTVKETDHDGKNVKSYKMHLSSYEYTIVDVVGAGDSLYFQVGCYSGGEFKIVFNLKTGAITEIGKDESE